MRGKGGTFKGSRAKWALGSFALALALPVVAQQAPESLLPPGFGDAPEAPTPAPPPARPAPGTPAASSPPTFTPILPPDPSLLAEADNATAEAEEELTPEELAAEKAKYDLPDTARRSLARIGPLTPRTRGLEPDAFGNQSGKYLATLMKETHAPILSRWASILLRRALLSATDTPRDIDGADWAAERAWLLLRMGEADSARIMVQSVDADRYTPRLYAIAMQTYLASADPAGLCPLSEGALRVSKEPGWDMTRAMCAALSGDQGTASGALNQAQRRGVVRGIDYRLAEKVVGTGFNARRSVKIEWDTVSQLTAWPFGLATALNVEIPDALFGTVGPHVRAWEARAPALSAVRRRPGVDVAARLGVFSSTALVGFYGQMSTEGDAPAVLAGYDRNAARWARALGQIDGDGAAQFWGLLAVGAPSPVVDINSGRISTYIDEEGPEKGRMLIAALAGLARLSADDAASLAQDNGVALAANSRWARAIGAAAQRGEKATVALLAAVGMQGRNWRRLPPAHLYHVVAALHRVGLDPEARMIAAEAISRT